MSFQPLDPEISIDPFAITSLTGPDNHTGIFLDVDQVNSSILVKTNDTNAAYIDKFQNVGINTTAPGAQLDVNSASGSCIQVTYNNSANKANFGVSSDGKLSFSTSGGEVNIDSASDFNIKSHNGTTTGLKLNNTLVLASADQLNYSIATPGTVSASKAVVVDSNKDISSFRNLTATNLTGTLQTAAQPNISSVHALDISTHNGSTVGLALGGVIVAATAAQLNYTNATQGSASASKALILDSNLDISGINSLSATSLTGTLQTTAQPNITSVGTLDGLDISGSITGLTDLSINTTTTGRTLVINSDAGNCFQLCYDTPSGSATNYVDMLVSSGGNLSITASGGNVDISTHNGSTGLKLGGTLVTASADQINYLEGTTPGTATNGKALIVNSSRNITNINSLSATSLTGTLQTAAQPNINSVNVLNVANHNGTIGLSLGGTVVTSTASELNYVDVTQGSASASKALVLDSSSDISGINSLSASSLTGTLQTAYQPNITSVDTLDITLHDGATTGLYLDGVLLTATATQLNDIVSGGGTMSSDDLVISDTITITNANGVDNGLILGSTLVLSSAAELNYLNDVVPGSGDASKALVLDSNSDIAGINSLSASELSGTLQTAAQPNITSVGTLTSITTSGNFVSDGVTMTATDFGHLSSITAGTATANKALVLDSSSNITGVGTISAAALTLAAQTYTYLASTTNGTGGAPNVASITTCIAYSPTLDMALATAQSTSGATTYYIMTNSTGFSAYSDFDSRGSNSSYVYSILWQSAQSRFIVHYSTYTNDATARTLYYMTSTNGINWSGDGISCGISILRGTSIKYHSASNQYVFFSTNKFYYSTLATNSWSSVTIGGNITNTFLAMDTTQIAGNYVFQKNGGYNAVMFWNGTTWAEAGTINTTTFPQYRAYSPTEDRLYMMNLSILTSATNTLVCKYIDNFSTLSFANWAANIQSVSFTNVRSTQNGMVVQYHPNYEIIITGTKSASVDPTNFSSSIRLLRIVNKQLVYDFTDGPTENAGRIYRVNNIQSQSFVGFNNSLIVPSTAAAANIHSVYSTPTGANANITFGSTTISEAEIGALDAVTPGTVVASKAVVVDSNKDISAFRNLTATNLTGTLQTATQANITSVGTLTSLNVASGTTTNVISTAFTSGNNTALTLQNTGTNGIANGMLFTAPNSTGTQVNLIKWDPVFTTNTAGSESSGFRFICLNNGSTATPFQILGGSGGVQAAAFVTDTAALTLTSNTVNTANQYTEMKINTSAGTQARYRVVFIDAGTSKIEAYAMRSNADSLLYTLNVSSTGGIMTGLNSITATSLTGTLQTAAQPNITSIGTLTSITTSGSLTMGATTISEAEIGVLDGVTPGTVTASKAIVVDSSSDITGINSLTATELTGTLQTAAQANITSVGTLTSITTSGTLTMGSTVISEAEIGVLDSVTPGTADASKALVLDSSSDITGINSLTATELTGTLQTAAQANITSVGTLTSITTSGALTMGTTVISEAEIGVLDSVTPGTVSASKAIVVDSNKDISSFRNLTATNLTGTLQTAAQANITSVGTLTSITTSGALTMGTTIISEAEIGVLDGVTPGTADASKALVLDSSSDISGINSLSASELTGTIQTASQPNITSVETLNINSHDGVTQGLSLNDILITATATELNYVDVVQGAASASKALVLDSSLDISGINSLSASELTGTLQTAAQANITSVGTLTSITTSGSLTMGTTTISEAEIGVLDGVTAGTVTASKAIVVDSNKDISAFRNLTATNLTGTLQTAAQANITSVGTLTSITTSGTLTMGATVISEAEIGVLDGVTPGTASASKALVLDSSSDITGINSLTATELTGTLQTAAQANITSVGTLTSITTSGDLTMGTTVISEAEIGVLDGVTPGTVTASKAIVVDSNKDISAFRNLTATNLTGTLQTAAQANITSVGTLTSIATSGDLTMGTTTISEAEIGVLDGVTPGTATASKAIVVDSNKDISSFRNLTATNLTGTLQTAAQANITSVGTLTSITTSGTLTMGSTVISEAEIGVLNAVTPGTASASKALVLDSSSDISGINSLGASVLAIGTPANSDLPVEIGFTSYQFTGEYAYNNEANAHGIVNAGDGPVANYSLRADGRIMAVGEIQLTSDRRMKKNITNIDISMAKLFILNSQPVRFNWKSGDKIPELGWIAQDVLKLGNGLEELVTVVPQPGLEEIVDDDGFINPANAKFTLATGKVTPLLTLAAKDLYEQNSIKDKKIASLEERLAALEAIIAKLA